MTKIIHLLLSTVFFLPLVALGQGNDAKISGKVLDEATGEPVTNDLETAKLEAKTGHKLIFMKFSGSDWCVPCINVQKKVIDTDEFQNFSHTRLVLMNIDFPRQKKNLLSADDTKKNATLAETYNREGLFPKFLLLDENGTVLAQWTGLEKMEPKFLESKILPFFENK